LGIKPAAPALAATARGERATGRLVWAGCAAPGEGSTDRGLLVSSFVFISDFSS